MISLALSSLLTLSIPLLVYSGTINSYLQTHSINLSNDFIAGMLYCFIILTPILLFAARDWLKNDKIRSKTISTLNEKIKSKDAEIQDLNNKIVSNNTEIQNLNKHLNNLIFVSQNSAEYILNKLQCEAVMENKKLNERLNNAKTVYKDQNKLIKEQEQTINDIRKELNAKCSEISLKRKQIAVTDKYLKTIAYDNDHSVYDVVQQQLRNIKKGNPTPKKQHGDFDPNDPIKGKRAERCQQNRAIRISNKAINDGKS